MRPWGWKRVVPLAGTVCGRGSNLHWWPQGAAAEGSQVSGSCWTCTVQLLLWGWYHSPCGACDHQASPSLWWMRTPRWVLVKTCALNNPVTKHWYRWVHEDASSTVRLPKRCPTSEGESLGRGILGGEVVGLTAISSHWQHVTVSWARSPAILGYTGDISEAVCTHEHTCLLYHVQVLLYCFHFCQDIP